MDGLGAPGPGRPGPVFDAHLHVVDPRFPLLANDGYLPEPFTVADYRERVRHLGVAGGAVVSGSFQGVDQTYLLDALARLGPSFAGVTQLPPDVPDAELDRLDAAGVRALRVNLRRGSGGTTGDRDQQLRLARRAHDRVGWHCEFYVDSRELGPLLPELRALPAIAIDHLGLHADGLDDVLRLVESGARVKATGFGRLALDPADALRRIAAVNPGALLAGTDLPSTRAPRPFADADLDLVAHALGPELARRALWSNAVGFYRVGV